MARRPDNPRPGLLVIDKPAGITSHDVVSRVRRLAKTRKVGHGGTLDPMATGVLVVGVGKATKLLTWVSGHSKEYVATIRFGIATNTDDAEGVPTRVRGCASLSGEDLERALAPLRGDIMQVPTTVSAIKVGGKRAYALARADFTAAEHTPHTNSAYPIWRLYQYRGLIAYNEGHYEDATNDLMSAWDASDKTDDELWMSLRRAERRAEQDRRHAVRGDGGARSWNVVIVP